MKPLNRSALPFLIISICFGVLYYFMLLTGIAYFISTVVGASTENKDVVGYVSDFKEIIDTQDTISNDLKDLMIKRLNQRTLW